MTKKEAVERFVDQLHQIPGELIRAAYRDDERWDEFELLASPQKACVYCGATLHEDADLDGALMWAAYDGEGCPECEGPMGCDCVIPQHSDLAWPAGWDTLFRPVWPDDEWVRRNLDAVAGCGFLVFDCQYCGILLAIDGAGYDFYEHHWIPLYEARGFKWENEK